MLTKGFSEARKAYLETRGKTASRLHAALIDMDGVLYDSMPWHARAWHRIMTEAGVECTVDEFFLYEGMTGPATIDLLFRRAFGRNAEPDEARELYARKGRYFKEYGKKIPMPGADRMMSELMRLDLRRVLVTGSAQPSLLESIDNDYTGAFSPQDRITALDVNNGKPHPEPYLRGLAKAGCMAEEAMVVENAPLGVRAGVAAGCFTVAVATGPVPLEAFEKEGAHLIVGSMEEFACMLKSVMP